MMIGVGEVKDKEEEENIDIVKKIWKNSFRVPIPWKHNENDNLD